MTGNKLPPRVLALLIADVVIFTIGMFAVQYGLATGRAWLAATGLVLGHICMMGTTVFLALILRRV